MLGQSAERNTVSFPWQFTRVPSFEASKFLITNEEFLEFVEVGGYEKKEFWSEEGRSDYRLAPQEDRGDPCHVSLQCNSLSSERRLNRLFADAWDCCCLRVQFPDQVYFSPLKHSIDLLKPWPNGTPNSSQLKHRRVAKRYRQVEPACKKNIQLSDYDRAVTKQ